MLPNVERLSDDALENLTRYVGAGGGLVFSFRTGWRHPDGSRRHHFPLYDLTGLSGPFGVFSFASSASPQRLEMRYGLPEHEFGVLPQGYFRHRDPAVLTRRQGRSCNRCKGQWSRWSRRQALCRRIWLISTIRACIGTTRCSGGTPGTRSPPWLSLLRAREDVSFAGELDRDAAEVGQAGTMRSLTNAARWAAGDALSVEVLCGATVEAAVRRALDGGSWVALFVNHGTTSWLHATSYEKSSPHSTYEPDYRVCMIFTALGPFRVVRSRRAKTSPAARLC